MIARTASSKKHLCLKIALALLLTAPFTLFAQSVQEPPPDAMTPAPPVAPSIPVTEEPPLATPPAPQPEPTAAPPTAPPETMSERNRARPITARPRRKGRAPSRKTARASGEYQVPLRFDPADNGFSVDNPQLSWAFKSESDAIDFGEFPIASNDISVTLDQIKRSLTPVKYDARKTEPWVTALSMRWPESMTKVGEVSIENLEGAKLWSFRVGTNERKAWRDEFEYATPEMKKNHANASWGRYDLVRSEFEFLYKGGLFRACLTYEENVAERLHICTAPFRSKSKGPLIRFFPIRENDRVPLTPPPGFYLADKKLKDDGILNFPIGKPLQLKVRFKSGATIDISSQPADPKLLDVIESANGQEIMMTGAGAPPVGKRVKIIQRPVTHFWAPTGIPQEKVWQAIFPADSPTLAVHGAFHIPFTLLFTYDRLPREEDRIYLEKMRSSGTFSDSPVVRGYVPSAGTVSSKESSATKTDPYHFEWKFSAPKQGEENRARVSIDNEDGTRPWIANYRMFRSYPSEVSGRMTGIMGSDYTFLILGELSAAHYFETIGSWQSPTLSKQRWGLAGRYFKALNSVQTASGAGVSDLSVLNLDLKYHILPGIWHRDELVGVMMSAEQITVAGINVSLMGGGAYWARTMPKVFNELFNLLPFMNYPKYVDVEFIYYPFSLTTGAAGGLSFALNFQGRVFWTDRFYGELGFGIRNYQFTVPSQNRQGVASNVALLTSYGSAGIGFVF